MIHKIIIRFKDNRWEIGDIKVEGFKELITPVRELIIEELKKQHKEEK